jgi:4-methyl-5(b-hydroxyethyl)-thiazole monophosphate biosynthesis
MKVLVPVAHGSESLETVTIVNVLRRADIEVTLAGVEPEPVIDATRGIRLVVDQPIAAALRTEFDLIALPGGEKGAGALSRCAPLIEALQRQRASGRWYAAICAAPALTLAPHGLLEGRRATCYPSFRENLAHYIDAPVVVDGNCITSQGPATAFAFALKLVETLAGAPTRQRVAAGALAA